MMKWFNNLKIGNKFLLVAAFLLVFLTLVAGTGVGGVIAINGLVQTAQRQQIPAIYQLSLSVDKVQRTLISNRQSLLPAELFRIELAVDTTERNLKLARDYWQSYLALAGSPEEQLLRSRIEPLWQTLQEETEEVNRLALLNTPEARMTATKILEQGNALSLVEMLTNLSIVNYRGTLDLSQKAQTTFDFVLIFIGVTFSLMIVTTVVVVLLLARSISQPLQTLGQITQALAQGDLSQEVPILRRDELGQLGTTYNCTLLSLRKLVQQIYEQTQQVSRATNELTTQASSQVAGSAQQAQAITEGTVAMQELNQSAEEIARTALGATAAVESSLVQARLVNELGNNMVVAHEQGRAMVARTIGAIFNLKEQIAAIEQNQHILVQQSASIKRVVGLIDNVAKNTHLLALNASIEAAGAGIYGNRFAVIAREVKRLADASVVATDEVRNALTGIAQAVEQASQSASAGLCEAEQAVREARQSDQILVDLAQLSQCVQQAAHEIVTQVFDTVNRMTNISHVTRQQQVASHQIMEKMVEIEAITSQTLSSIRHGEAATHQLNQSVQELEHSADTFKLNP